MRFLITLVLVFIVLLWDIGWNRGQLIRGIIAMAGALLSAVGLR